MNKKQLAAKVGEKIKLSRTKSEKIIDCVLDTMTEALLAGEKVRLVGFGNFIVKTRKGRIGRNPQTGEKITIEATRGPVFVSGINLKKAVREKPAQPK